MNFLTESQDWGIDGIPVTLRPLPAVNNRSDGAIRHSRSGTHGHRMIWLTETCPISPPDMASWRQTAQFGQASQQKAEELT